MEWTRGPVIGRGSSAVVSLATASTGETVAVKSSNLSCSSLLQHEQDVLSQLCSPYVVKCLGSEKDEQVFNLFLEYAQGGTLSDLIREQGGCLNEKEIQFYAHQMLQGLNYLHLNGLAHCDIKGQNMLIGDEGLKIADFGCARLSSGCSASPAFAGTPAYMAPEVARGEEQDCPADIWAFGCTVIEMATGSNPWPDMKDPASVLYRVGYSGDVPELPLWLSDVCKDFLGKCLVRDSKGRWTAAELLQHEFVNAKGMNRGVKEITGKSPTSVMDQGFWDATEVSSLGSSGGPTRFSCVSSGSVAGRIRGLVGGAFSSNLSVPDWTEDADWVTVRGNEFERCPNTSQDCDECSMFSSVVDEEEIETSVAIEDSLFNSSSDDGISVSETSTLSILPSETGEYGFVLGNVIFNEIVEMETFPHINFPYGLLAIFPIFLYVPLEILILNNIYL